MITNDATKAAHKIIDRNAPHIVIAMPLGLGKPIQLLNALYKKIKNNEEYTLTVITALTLSRPIVSHPLAKKLYDPILYRIYGDYEDLDIELDRRAQKLPKNVRVIEFFFQAGAYINNSMAQRNYVCSNYTHAIRDITSYKVNVLATLVSPNPDNKNYFSLSSNTDLSKELYLASPNVMVVGEVNKKLPYMYGNYAEVTADRFDVVLDNKDTNKKLFSVPKSEINTIDYMIGFHVSSLIKDDGCLQMGIGSLGDAIAYALILRQKHTDLYNNILSRLTDQTCNLKPFDKGLCAITEMFVDVYLELYKANILKKDILGTKGQVLQAGFFIGSNKFYEDLRVMPKEERSKFSMRSIYDTNHLYGDEALKRKQRKNACFVNSAMKASLLGAISSDALSSQQTISGVGGQYNFVAMAHELSSCRSIIMCRSVREKNNSLRSNIVFKLDNVTIPRHLRDIVITEYGIADLRGKTDEEVIKAMLNIADSRFQKELLKKAKQANKIDKDYTIPLQYRNNLPHELHEKIKSFGSFPSYPFGKELSDSEVVLKRALENIKKSSYAKKIIGLIKGVMHKANKNEEVLLKRLSLHKTKGMRDYVYKLLVLNALRDSNKTTQ